MLPLGYFCGMQIPCPHCEKMINPAELLGKTTSEAKKASSAVVNGRKHVGKKSPLGGVQISKTEAMKGLGDPSTWPAHAEAVNAEFRRKPSVTDSPLPAVSAPVNAQDAPNQAVGVNQAVPVGVKKPRRDFFAGLRPAAPEPPFEKVVREPFIE
jgi:hypothetical protein